MQQLGFKNIVFIETKLYSNCKIRGSESPSCLSNNQRQYLKALSLNPLFSQGPQSILQMEGAKNVLWGLNMLTTKSIFVIILSTFWKLLGGGGAKAPVEPLASAVPALQKRVGLVSHFLPTNFICPLFQESRVNR